MNAAAGLTWGWIPVILALSLLLLFPRGVKAPDRRPRPPRPTGPLPPLLNRSDSPSRDSRPAAASAAENRVIGAEYLNVKPAAKRIELAFTHHPPKSDDQVERCERIRSNLKAVAGLFADICPDSRELNKALGRSKTPRAMRSRRSAVTSDQSRPPYL